MWGLRLKVMHVHRSMHLEFCIEALDLLTLKAKVEHYPSLVLGYNARVPQ
jgi:hypothetical protein